MEQSSSIEMPEFIPDITQCLQLESLFFKCEMDVVLKHWFASECSSG